MLPNTANPLVVQYNLQAIGLWVHFGGLQYIVVIFLNILYVCLSRLWLFIVCEFVGFLLYKIIQNRNSADTCPNF